MRGRAHTRHQRERAIARTRRKFRHWWGGDMDDEWIKKHSTFRGICSCWMCGNPRKHFGELTIQERRAEQ